MNRIVACSLIALSVLVLSAADWAEFRGPGGNGVARVAAPVKWSETENVAWKAEIPGRGPASPIVVGDLVVVTCSSGTKQDRLHVLGFDSASGERQWHRQFWATGRTYTHPSMGVAAPTPASDGERIFAFYSSNDLVCLDLEGNLLWYRGLAHDFPKAGNDVGMSSSPVVAGNTVIVQVECQGDSFATGLNVENGETRWHVERAHGANWSSPTILPGNGKRKDVVLLQSPTGLTAHDVATGDEVWKFEEKFGTIPSPLVVGSRVYLPTNGLIAFEFGEDSYSPEVVWESRKLGPGAPSPIQHKDRLYVLSGTVLTCADANSGKSVWNLRVPGGRYWATPVIAGDHLYCVNQDGLVRVIKLGEKKGEIVAENKFDDTLQATPAISNGAIYFRGDAHLWKVAEK